MSISQASAGQNGAAHDTTHAHQSAPAQSAPVHQTPGLAWAIRRAVLGIVIMTVAVAAGACLLYFTIDPEAEARAEGDIARKPVATATPLRAVR